MAYLHWVAAQELFSCHGTFTRRLDLLQTQHTSATRYEQLALNRNHCARCCVRRGFRFVDRGLMHDQTHWLALRALPRRVRSRPWLQGADLVFYFWGGA